MNIGTSRKQKVIHLTHRQRSWKCQTAEVSAALIVEDAEPEGAAAEVRPPAHNGRLATVTKPER